MGSGIRISGNEGEGTKKESGKKYKIR